MTTADLFLRGRQKGITSKRVFRIQSCRRAIIVFGRRTERAADETAGVDHLVDE